MATFARLKNGVTVAPRIFGRFLYPNVKTWIKFEDHCYDTLKADDRIEVLSQTEMDYMHSEQKNFIDELINRQWRSVEKQISTIDDLDILKKASAEAKAIGKNQVSKVIDDRIQELEG